MSTSAEEVEKIDYSSIYETDEAGEYLSGSRVNLFSYGKGSIGELFIYGNITERSSYDGYTAFAAGKDIVMRYKYDGSYQSKEKEEWNLKSDKGKSVGDIELQKKIALGAVVIQKSSDGKNWTDAREAITDFFDKNSGLVEIGSISSVDIKNGTYYRVIVAYEVGKKVGKTGNVIKTDEYEYKRCTEVYEFYVHYNTNPIIVREINTRKDISKEILCQDGFLIDKNFSSDSVTLSKGGSKTEVDDFMSVYDPGNYTIDIESAVGKRYQYNIRVKDGLSMYDLKPQVYENKKKDDYKMNQAITGNTSFGLASFTTLRIGRKYGNDMTTATKDGFDAYGISGEKVCLYMELADEKTINDNGWEIRSDDYGKKEKEKIGDVYAGQVGTGALIIQTSSDGKNWSEIDRAKYSEGLYTTDYNKHYSKKGNVCIYTPDGKQLLNGLYVRVLYAYMAYEVSSKEYKKYIENYSMYLCSNNLEAVTFHNLSVNGKMESMYGDKSQDTINMYKSAETLTDGMGTVTGFEIDTKLNPTVTYSILKDGQEIKPKDDNTYKTTGKYTINLESAVGDKKTLTLYVDTESLSDSMDTYFGEFITGKRIYDEDSKYPVYEGGLTNYNIRKVNDNLLPISGKIRNITTGEDIVEISGTRSEKTGLLEKAGEYEAVFTTNPNYGKGESGDSRKFTFHFKIIENGTAPGPVVNRRNLIEHNTRNIVSAYPMYYAITDKSAAKGYIDFAFASKDAAQYFSYKYEKGMVEDCGDGTYKYIGSNVVSTKKSYDDLWELTEEIDKYSKEAVQEKYIDVSDVNTYITLRQNLIDRTENVRKLELNRSVVIYADEKQKEVLTSKNSLPIIGSIPYAFLSDGINGKVSKGKSDFVFIKDEKGIDSYSVVIKDSKGSYPIKYNKSVSSQLEAAGVRSGVVSIVEKNIHGDQTTYDAIYFAPDENTAQIKLVYYEDGVEKECTVTQKDNGKIIDAEAFCIMEIKDELDPYNLICITKEGQEDYKFVADKLQEKKWEEPGKYTIKAVNHVGNIMTFDVNIN